MGNVIHHESGSRLHLPTLAGYSLLKLRAWADRSQRHEYKDGPDVGLILRWATDAPLPKDPDDDYVSWFELYEADVDLVRARSWGRMVAVECGSAMASELLRGLHASNLHLLSRFAAGGSRLDTSAEASRRARADQLIDALLAGLGAAV
jgi:predicted nucleotidyltransferase